MSLESLGLQAEPAAWSDSIGLIRILPGIAGQSCEKGSGVKALYAELLLH